MAERVVKIGTIGWNYPEWRGLVYPARAKPDEFLRHYAECFPIVEAASSYYGMPKTAAVESWATTTPDGFEISLKVPDWIVRKPVNDPDLPRALDAFLTRLSPLSTAGKLGALVAQFHPSYHRDKHAADLRTFVAALPTGPRWAIELRHPSWWREDTFDALSAHNVTLVWSALGGPSDRMPPVVTSDALYLRLFGDRELAPPYDTKRRDASAELDHWVQRIRNEGRGASRVDVLVSKYLEGYAPGTAARLAEMLDVEPPRPHGARQTTLP